jgi:long-chain acyl-CoA synthetase
MIKKVTMSLNKNTICDLFLERTSQNLKSNSIGCIDKKSINFVDYKTYKETVEALTIALLNIGIDTFAKVCILSHTRKEWHFCDLAIMSARAITVPIYPTYTKEEVDYILNHSEAQVLIVENQQQLDKILTDIDSYKYLKKIISIENIKQVSRENIPTNISFLTLDECINLGIQGIQMSPDQFSLSIQNIAPSDIATIVYTSGTTGEPKGAVISHKAFFQVLTNIKIYSHHSFDSNDRLLIYLPLSHVLGRCESFFTILFGLETVYAESINKIMDNIPIVQPTIMLGVPRIFEKIYERVSENLNENLVKKELFSWAMNIANTYFDKIDNDKSPSSQSIIKYQLAKKLLFKKILDRFGGKIRFFISGGAPLSPEIIKFLRNVGLTVLEGYGLTETVAPCCVNPMDKQVPGSVGQPIGDVQIKFLDDGEILIKTEALFSNYYKNEEATKEVFTDDGWFKTGDIGKFNSQGFLKITDRKKDLIITSGGKNVAPQKIENMLKLSPYIAQSAIIGDQKKYLTALISIERESLLPLLSKFEIVEHSEVSDLSIHPSIIQLIEREIDKTNEQLASFESIKKFKIVPVECSTDDYLTPSLKLKKKAFIQDHEMLINAMYNAK